MNGGSIHEQARRLAAQSPRPLGLAQAYAELGRRGAAARRRRAHYGRTTVDPRAFEAIETPQRRLPYRDD